MGYVLLLRKALVGLAVVSLSGSCGYLEGPLSGSWRMDSPIDSEHLLKRTDDALHPLGYAYTKGPMHVDQGTDCMWYQRWSEREPRRHDGGGKNVEVSVPGCGSRIEVRLLVRGTHWTNEELDHYYFLRDELFPRIVGKTSDELNIETQSHPAKNIPIGKLAHFDREPLNAQLGERLARWRAGEWPTTEELQRRILAKKAASFATGYGMPMAVGSVIFWGLWRFIRKESLSTKAQRFWFVVIGVLVYAPIPVLLMGWTTLGYAVVRGWIFFVVPMYLISDPLYFLIPLAIGAVFWVLAVWVLPPKPSY